jgi:spoIIIJ-associated protein
MDHSLIVATIKELVSKLGVTCDSVVLSESGGNTVFSIQTRDATLLTGVNGETLSAINHLVKKILEPKIPRDVHYVVDVNGFHTRKIKALEDQARLVAERARTFRYDIELPPMTAYERMIVHSTLKEMSDIQTVSHGEGALRHIVVRYLDPSKPAAAPTHETA